MADRATRAISRRPWLVVLGVAALLFLADQVTKALIATRLPLGGEVVVVGDLVVLSHVRNRGAAFSLFQGEMLLFVAVTVFAHVMIVYFYRSFRDRALWLHAVLGLQLGGALGNLADRVRLGYVTDFVSVGIGTLRWPTFNVADAAIVVGIGTLAIYLVLHPERKAPALA